MDYQALKALLETHPQWPTVTDEELLTWGSDPTGVTRDREEVPVKEIFAVIDYGDFKQTDDQDWIVQSWNLFEAIDVVSPHSLRQRYIDGLKDPSLSAFLALIPEQVSRFTHANLYSVRLGDIEYARTL